MLFFINYVFLLATLEIPMYFCVEMTFEQIPHRMITLGVDREWLAKECDYSPRTLGAILAPKSSAINKTQKALRRIWEALDREEARQNQPKVQTLQESNQLVIKPTEEEFTHWSRVSASKGQPILEWCIESLNEAARAWRKDYRNDTQNIAAAYVAEDQTQYKTTKK